MQYVWCPSVRRRHWQERTSTRVTWAISKDTKLTQSSSLQISTGPSPFLCSNVIMHSSLARHLTKKFLDALIQVLVWVGGTVAFWKEGVWVMNNRCRNILLIEWSTQSMKSWRGSIIEGADCFPTVFYYHCFVRHYLQPHSVLPSFHHDQMTKRFPFRTEPAYAYQLGE